MKIRVKFIGDDLGFYEKIQERFQTQYSTVEFNFFFSSLKGTPNLYNIYREIYKQRIDIIFVDYEDQKDFCFELCKLVNSNTQLRKKSLCALHGINDSSSSIHASLLSQVRINHIKGVELHNIVYDTISFVDADLAKTPAFLDGKAFGKVEVLHDVRIGYLYDDMFHVELSTRLPENTIIELTEHPLDHLAQSKRFLVRNEKDSNLFYNTRYSYDLEMTYIDNVFFRSTESDWLDYKEYAGQKDKYEELTGLDYELMEKNVKTRKSKIRYLREEIREWIEEHANEDIKKVKVQIFDDTLDSLEEIKKIEEFIPKYETGLVYDFYQIRRFNPHIIIFNLSEKQDDDKLQELLNYLSEFSGNPFLIVTNREERIPYEKGLNFSGSVDVETLQSLVETFTNKVDISSDLKRVFFPPEYKKVAVKVKLNFDIIAFNESVMYFIYEGDIPMWTVFEIKEGAIDMLLTVVPDVSNSKFASEKNCYRALISGPNELEMAKLRVLINQSLEEKEEEQSE